MSDELKSYMRKMVREKMSEVGITTEAHKDFVPYGSDVSSGIYECVDCGYLYSNQSKKSLPPCPNPNKIPHEKNGWKILTGRGDAVDDPYPERK